MSAQSKTSLVRASAETLSDVVKLAAAGVLFVAPYVASVIMNVGRRPRPVVFRSR